jgi:hypothetical protein
MLPHRYDERGSASHRAFAHVTFSTGTATLRCSRSNAEKWRYERDIEARVPATNASSSKTTRSGTKSGAGAPAHN